MKSSSEQKKSQFIATAAKELAERQMEGLRLFRPQPHQIPFFTTQAQELLLRGGNRAGKSLCAAVIFASALTGVPITMPDGTKIEFSKWKAPLTTWVIGYDQTHIGKTLYRLLFRPGAFKIIKDQGTGKWRCWRGPNDPHDGPREKETKPAPPLIPPRFIDPKGWAWENKALRVFSVCRLINGSEIRAFSSKGEAAQGDTCHIIWIDEDIEYPGHVIEWEMRLAESAGMLLWSLFPHSRNDAYQRLKERAERERDYAKKVVAEVTATFEDNAYIPDDQKVARKEGMSHEEWLARNFGELCLDGVLNYPNFSLDVHGVPNRNADNDSEFDRMIRDRGCQPPDDWTRYLILDPGHVQAAVLFAAVAPPDKYGELYYLFDELYPRRMTAEEVAALCKKKMGNHQYEAFIIDKKAGDQTPMGYGKTIEQHYAESFKNAGISSRSTGNHFIPGSPDIENGKECVRDWLRIQANKRTKLIVNRNLDALRFEFANYKKKIVGGITMDKDVDQHNHLMSCLRYFAAFEPYYRKPAPPVARNMAQEAYDSIMKQFDRSERTSGTIYVGIGAAV